MLHLSNKYSMLWKWLVGDTDPRVKTHFIKSVSLVIVLFCFYIPLFIFNYLLFYQETTSHELSFNEVCAFVLVILLTSSLSANLSLKSMELLSTKMKCIPYSDRPVRATITFYFLTMLLITLISLSLKAIFF